METTSHGGETTPRGEDWATEAPYDWEHCPFNNGSKEFDEEYFNAHKSEWLETYSEEDIRLKSEYDTAHKIMGGSWRMPTLAEMQELLDETTQVVENLNGISGMRFTAPNGSSIFMPFAGCCEGSDFMQRGSVGHMFSSSPGKDEELEGISASSISIYNFGGGVVGNFARNWGCSVRGVC